MTVIFKRKLEDGLSHKGEERHTVLLLRYASESGKVTFPRHVTDQLPRFNEVWVFALQQHHALVGTFLKFLLCVKPLLGFLW